jgi:hypothetical protein
MKLTCAIVITGFLYGAFLLGAEGRQLDQCHVVMRGDIFK